MKHKNSLVGHVLCLSFQDGETEKYVKKLVKVLKFGDEKKNSYIIKVKGKKDKSLVDRETFDGIFSPIKDKISKKKC